MDEVGVVGVALRRQRRQRLADLLVARAQVWLLLPQLGEQRLGAELGMSEPQPAGTASRRQSSAMRRVAQGDDHTQRRYTGTLLLA